MSFYAKRRKKYGADGLTLLPPVPKATDSPAGYPKSSRVKLPVTKNMGRAMMLGVTTSDVQRCRDLADWYFFGLPLSARLRTAVMVRYLIWQDTKNKLERSGNGVEIHETGKPIRYLAAR